jgi:tetratricopeptide (TPR) repeat protein
VTIPAAALGAENPLPALRPLDELHRVDVGDRSRLPADMARQLGYAPLRTLLPVRLLDGYGRDRAPAALDALVIENDLVEATVLPGLGGRLYSLVDKETGRELLYRNPVFQPANLALADAWFSGGVEWNLGATGHSAYTCRPLHAARVAAPDGGEMLRLWEWERLRDLPFQIDMWLPEHSRFLYVGLRVRNPHDHTVPAYWWSNIAVPEAPGTRVLAPADSAFRFDYTRALDRVPVPHPADGVDISYTTRAEPAADYFFDLADGERRWVTALDGDGRGLVQTSTDVLRGRKLFLWGTGRGGRRWQEWLTEPGTGGYLEIQAGLARTQLEHLPMPADSSFSWLEAYGPLHADPARVHGADWADARAAAAEALEAALPRTAVEEAYTAWIAHADDEPKDTLATGSGWGALEAERGRHHLPGTPFPATTLGAEQKPWLELLLAGVFPRPAADGLPGHALVSAPWRDLLESADTYPGNEWFLDYHLGIAQWAAGDRAQAVRSWERSTAAHPSPWALRALAVAETDADEPQRAADRYAEAWESLRDSGLTGDAVRAVHRALLLEAVPAMLAAGRPEDAAALLAAPEPPAEARSESQHGPQPGSQPGAGAVEGPGEDGRLTLLRARTALAQGRPDRARAYFDEGFTVGNLREGDETLSATWYAIAEQLVAGDGPVTDAVRERARAQHPLPAAYDYRMRPET